MLRLQQPVSSKNEDKTIKYAELVSAVNFAFGPKDELEDFTTSITDAGKPDKQLTYKVPKEKTTKESPDDLQAAMINYFQAAYPNENPILVLCSRATDSENVVLKNKAKATLEPMDQDEEIKKLVKHFTSKFGLDAATAENLAKETFAKAQSAKAA